MRILIAGGRVIDPANRRDAVLNLLIEGGRIVEVAFKPANPRFRESLAKPPRKRPNAERRSRESLSPGEVERLIEAAQGVGPHGHRDATMILIAYRHALGE